MWVYVVLIIVVIILYIRNCFWFRQPISHMYHFYSGLMLTYPLMNKYCDTLHVIETPCTPELVDYIKKKAPYFKSSECIQDHVVNSFITIYINPSIAGCLLSQKINFSLCKHAYYHEMYADTKKIQQVLFQTHEYLRCTKTKCPVSIFSTPTKIPILKPLLHYPIQWIKTDTFRKYKLPYKIIRATPEMIYHDYSTWKNKFKCYLLPSIDSIIYKMKHKQLSIFYYDTSILFFKNTFEIEQTHVIIDWVGTIGNSDLVKPMSTLFHHFKKMYPIVRVHGVSHTPNYKGYKTTYVNHYVYNFGIQRQNPQKCLCIL